MNSARPERPRVRVIGCGNSDAGDDAAGLMAVAGARAKLADTEGVEVVEAGPGLHVLDLIEGVETVVVVDAVRTKGGGRPPGTIVHVRVGEPFPPALSSALSSHEFGLAETIGLAAELGRVARVAFLGVEVGDVRAGAPLSEAVAAAVPALTEMVVAEVAGVLDQAEASGGGGGG
jgi:hydrogenase maturation protease